MTRIVSAAFAAAMLTACTTKQVAPAPSQPSQPTQTMPTGTVPVDAALRPLVDLATADLARRLSLDPTAIAVVEARAVVWPDGAMGCPRPGLAYPQVQQEGALIRLKAGGREYAYHSGGSRPPFLCENP